jgi:hypothetical protein
MRRLRTFSLVALLGGAAPLIAGAGPARAQAPAGPKAKVAAARADDEVLRRLLGLGPVPLPQGWPIDAIAFSADGKAVTTVSNVQARVLVWDAATGELLRRVKLPLGAMDNSAVSADSRLVAAVDYASKVSVWEAATGRKVRRMNGASGSSLAFSPDGKSVLAATNGGQLGVWDVATGKRRCALPKSAATRDAVPAFSPDGKLVAATRPDGSIGLWEAATGKELRPVAAGLDRCRFLSFLPDGRRLAACDGAGLVRFWDVATARERLQFQLPAEHRLSAGRFSRDGRALVTGGLDGTVRMWELATGGERFRFPGNGVAVNTLTLAPGGRSLATAGYDQRALIRAAAPSTGLPSPPRVEDVRVLWADLAGVDGLKAYRAVAALAARPAEAVPFLKERIRPAAVPDGRAVARLLKDLGSPAYVVREKAMKELERLHRAVEPDLVAALRGDPPPEVQQRLAMLLGRVKQPSRDPERRRTLRAIEALELAGTREARQVLRALARGAAEDEITWQAQAALRRLERRPASRPKRPNSARARPFLRASLG